MYPQVHCTAAGDMCQVTAGESEINAATSVTALVLGSSAQFDLRRTYFLASGIAGVNPKLATLGGVALARFAVQVALQYELDARELVVEVRADAAANVNNPLDNEHPPGHPNSNPKLTTGYLPYGGFAPSDYPTVLYGTEVLELNAALRDRAADLARRANLSDSAGVAAHRARYANAQPAGIYDAATQAPAVHACDVATSDVYYSGTLLSEAFENTTRVWTNQTQAGQPPTYCMTAQEDVAVLEALLRAHLWGLVDYTRAIVMRTGGLTFFFLFFFPPPPPVLQSSSFT